MDFLQYNYFFNLIFIYHILYESKYSNSLNNNDSNKLSIYNDKKNNIIDELDRI
jgi:hypothetical protein